jgi:hypothetical protein
VALVQDDDGKYRPCYQPPVVFESDEQYLCGSSNHGGRCNQHRNHGSSHYISERRSIFKADMVCPSAWQSRSMHLSVACRATWY